MDSDEDNVDVGEFIRTNVGKCSAMFEAAISNSDGLKCEAVDKEHSKSGNDTDNAVVSADYEMDSNSVIAVSEMVNDEYDSNDASDMTKFMRDSLAKCTIMFEVVMDDNDILKFEAANEERPANNAGLIINSTLNDAASKEQAQRKKLDALLKCLKNRSQYVRAKIQRAEIALKNERRNNEEEQNDDDGNLKITNYYYRFGMPYFKDSAGFRCPFRNKDSDSIKRNDHTMLFSMDVIHGWKDKHLERLENLIAEYWFDQMAIVERAARKKFDTGSIHDSRKLHEISEEIQRQKLLNFDQLLKIYAGKPIDWLAIAAKSESKLWSDPRQCENAWNVKYNPKFSSDVDFEPDEQDKLIDLMQQFNYRNWDEIATRLDTGKSAFQCFIYSKTALRCLVRETWSAEDDDLLKRCVRKYTISDNDGNDRVRWSLVSTDFPNKNVAQCYTRYRNHIKDGLKKGHFTAEEADTIEAYRRDGLSFGEISVAVGDRSTAQIRDFIQNKTKHTNRGRWSLRETLELIRAILEHGVGRWAAISKRLTDRDRTQCRLKYEHLCQIGYKNLERALTDFEKLKNIYGSEVVLHKSVLKAKLRDLGKIRVVSDNILFDRETSNKQKQTCKRHADVKGKDDNGKLEDDDDDRSSKKLYKSKSRKKSKSR